MLCCSLYLVPAEKGCSSPLTDFTAAGPIIQLLKKIFSNLVRPRCKYILFCTNSLVEEVHSRKGTNKNRKRSYVYLLWWAFLRAFHGECNWLAPGACLIFLYANSKLLKQCTSFITRFKIMLVNDLP